MKNAVNKAKKKKKKQICGCKGLASPQNIKHIKHQTKFTAKQ